MSHHRDLMITPNGKARIHINAAYERVQAHLGHRITIRLEPSDVAREVDSQYIYCETCELVIVDTDLDRAMIQQGLDAALAAGEKGAERAFSPGMEKAILEAERINKAMFDHVWGGFHEGQAAARAGRPKATFQFEPAELTVTPGPEPFEPTREEDKDVATHKFEIEVRVSTENETDVGKVKAALEMTAYGIGRLFEGQQCAVGYTVELSEVVNSDENFVDVRAAGSRRVLAAWTRTEFLS